MEELTTKVKESIKAFLYNKIKEVNGPRRIYKIYVPEYVQKDMFPYKTDFEGFDVWIGHENKVVLTTLCVNPEKHTLDLPNPFEV